MGEEGSSREGRVGAEESPREGRLSCALTVSSGPQVGAEQHICREHTMKTIAVLAAGHISQAAQGRGRPCSAPLRIGMVIILFEFNYVYSCTCQLCSCARCFCCMRSSGSGAESPSAAPPVWRSGRPLRHARIGVACGWL